MREIYIAYRSLLGSNKPYSEYCLLSVAQNTNHVEDIGMFINYYTNNELLFWYSSVIFTFNTSEIEGYVI